MTGDPQLERLMPEIYKGFSDLGLPMNPSNARELSEITSSINATHEPAGATVAFNQSQEIVEAIADGNKKSIPMQIMAIVTNAGTYFETGQYKLCIEALDDAVTYADNTNEDELGNQIYELMNMVKWLMPK